MNNINYAVILFFMCCPFGAKCQETVNLAPTETYAVNISIKYDVELTNSVVWNLEQNRDSKYTLFRCDIDCVIINNKCVPELDPSKVLHIKYVAVPEGIVTASNYHGTVILSSDRSTSYVVLSRCISAGFKLYLPSPNPDCGSIKTVRVPRSYINSKLRAPYRRNSTWRRLRICILAKRIHEISDPFESWILSH